MAEPSEGGSEEAEKITELYDRHARTWDAERWRTLFERPWLERFLASVPRGGSILDLGCGSGEPIARHLIEAGYELTGIDGSAAMISICRARFPAQAWRVADMRRLHLDRRFDGLIAWDSLFHLTQADQRAMFATFQEHSAPGAALMFTSGPQAGEAMGSYQGQPLYHASLAPDEYGRLLHEHGFELVSHVARDAAAGGRTIWLARRPTPIADKPGAS